MIPATRVPAVLSSLTGLDWNCCAHTSTDCTWHVFTIEFTVRKLNESVQTKKTPCLHAFPTQQENQPSFSTDTKRGVYFNIFRSIKIFNSDWNESFEGSRETIDVWLSFQSGCVHCQWIRKEVRASKCEAGPARTASNRFKRLATKAGARAEKNRTVMKDRPGCLSPAHPQSSL